MAINFTDLRTNLFQSIKGLTNLKCYWQQQNAPAFVGDHLALKISTIDSVVGTDYVSKPDENGAVHTAGYREFILNVIAVSPEAMGELINLEIKLNEPFNLNFLNDKGIVFVDAETPPIDITIMRDKNYETRAYMELRFRISKNYCDPAVNTIDIIESAKIDGILTGTKQNINVEIDVQNNN